MITTETSHQERFVVGFALVAGLFFFGWIFHHNGWSWRAPEFKETGESAVLAPLDKGVIDSQAWLTDRVDRTETDLSDLTIAADDRMSRLELAHADDVTALSAAIEADRKVRLERMEQEGSELAALKRQRALDAERIRLLELQFLRIRSATAESRLFVTGEDFGDARATALFTRLRGLENTAPAAIEAEYLKIGGEMKATPAVRIRYQTAGSEVQEDDRLRIEKLAAESPEGTYFLVAGYADTTGDAETNRILSSKRATTAAEILDRRTRADQTVRAIYLGQTRRFGPEAENRVVEIWAIRP